MFKLQLYHKRLIWQGGKAKRSRQVDVFGQDFGVDSLCSRRKIELLPNFALLLGGKTGCRFCEELLLEIGCPFRATGSAR